MASKKITISFAFIFSALITGCASFPETEERPSLEESANDVVDGWNSTKAITFRPNRTSLDIDSPEQIPDSVRKKVITLSTPGYIGPQDLVFILDQIGVQSIIASQGFSDTSIYIPSYKGDVGSFLDLISDSSNMSFRWSGGAVIVDDTRRYTVRIAQQKDLTDIIASAIGSLGAEEVFASKESGSITYSASTRHQKNISDYLSRLSVNTALIQLQLAVINVSLKDERKTGFDWSSFNLNLGDAALLDGGFGTIGKLGKLTGSGAGITLNDSNMSLTAALNLLSTYGESRTAQNLTLQTLSGVPVSLSSGDEIPYVKDIPTTSSESNVTQGVQTEVVKTGFEVDVEALYDGDESMVTVSMNLSLTSLIGFRELSAGNSLGTITQPEIQKQDLNSIVKLGAGETALLGGLIIETFSDNRRNLAALERLPFGSQSLDNNQSAVFIMLRPTVTVFGNEK